MDSRRQQLRAAAERVHDLVVIGGGINGAGIARDAAARGLDVVLIDQHDWGFGTTWRSTKLIHGGLRYLEHGELGLVFESLRERAVPFLLPSYRGDRHALPVLRAGLTLYDLLAWGGGLPRHHVLDRRRTLALEPRLRADGLRGGLAYWDAQVELPERLCIENVLRARDSGAIVLSYVKIERILASRGRVHGVAVSDRRSGEAFEVPAQLVVNAAGPWVDRVLGGSRSVRRRIGGTRGTHLVARFPGGGPRRALYAEAAGDRRPFFIVPWRGAHLIGTTDVRVDDADDLLPSDEEVEYLIEATQALVPGDRLRPEDVWYAYAGIRPLPFTETEREGAITRRHHVIDHAADGAEGLISVVGGKLSTYRRLAMQVTERAARRLGQRGRFDTARTPLVAGDWRPRPDEPEERRLWRIYGPRAAEVLRLQQNDNDPQSAERLCPHTLDTVAQATYAIQCEGALTVGDVLLRRTPAGWSRCLGLDAAPRVAALLADAVDGGQAAAIAAYEREARSTFRPVGSSCCFA
jgi:glycerol-3-phosphate dehydrogenase